MAQAFKDTLNLLEDPELELLHKELYLSFDESTIAEQAKRTAHHKAIMIISNSTTPGANNAEPALRSQFALSKVWVRAGG